MTENLTPVLRALSGVPLCKCGSPLDEAGENCCHACRKAREHLSVVRTAAREYAERKGRA